MKAGHKHTNRFWGEHDRSFLSLLAGMSVFAGLYVASLKSYLLFHSLAELFSIVIAFGIFVIAWNSRSFLNNNYLLFIGIAYLFVGGIDLVHTLAYKGMGVFKNAGANEATQVWIAGRALQSFSLLAAPLFIGRRLRPSILFAVYASVTALLLFSIFGSSWFPACYVNDSGLTDFKKMAEYGISLVQLLSAGALLSQRKSFDTRLLRLLLSSIVITVLSEFSFTFYVGVYDFSNLVGHLLKIVAFYLIYLAIIKTAVRDPFMLIFRDLKQREEELQSAKDSLEMRVAERTHALNESKERLEHEIEERKRAEESLKEQFSTLGAILESTDTLIFSVDRQYGYTSFNTAHASVMKRIYGAEIRIGDSILDSMSVAEDRETAKRNLERSFKGERHVQTSYSGEDSRERLYFEVSHNPIFSDHGSVIGVAVLSRDITESKRAEEALQESEKRYKQLLESVTDYIYTVQVRDSRPLATIHGPGCIAVTGYASEDYETDSNLWYRMIYEQDRAAVTEQATAILSGKAALPIEHRIIHRDGSLRWVRNTPVARYDKQQNLIGYDGLVADITDRKRAEEALRESEQKYHDIFENVLDGLYLLEVTDGGRFRTLEINAALERSTGMPRANVIGKTQEECLPEATAAVVNAKYRHCVMEGRPIEEEATLDLPAGRRYYLSTLIPVQDARGRVNRIIGIARDITDRELADEALRASEERFHMVFENSPVSIWEEDFSRVKGFFDDLKKQGVVDLVTYFAEHPEAIGECAALTKIIDVNRAALALHGAGTKEELLAGLVKTFTADSFVTFRKELVYLWNGATSMSSDTVIQTLAGESRNVTIYFTVCPGCERTFSRVLVSLVDMSERKKAEDALQKLNEELELRVQDRTAELERKNRELERLNRVFVGRELRMAELKKKIRDLKKPVIESSPL